MNQNYLKRYYTILSWFLVILVIVGLQGKVALGRVQDTAVSETKETSAETEGPESSADQSAETEGPESSADQSAETEGSESSADQSAETEESESDIFQHEETDAAGESEFFWYDPNRTILLMEAPGIEEAQTPAAAEAEEALTPTAAEAEEAPTPAAAEAPDTPMPDAVKNPEVHTPLAEETEEALSNHPEAEDPSKDEQEMPVPDLEETSFLEVCYLDIGQGDAILIVCDGHSMLIDGGSPSRSDTIYTVLKKRGITYLDYIVSSHPDNDHLGGLPAALSYTKADVALSPVPEDERDRFYIFQKKLAEQNLELTIPCAGDQFALGSATITVLGPIELDGKTENPLQGKKDNNCSLVLRLDYAGYRFLFPGDAEVDEEMSLLKAGVDLKSDVLKIAHHGSKNSTTDDWLQTIDPSVAIISCGENNPYNHPSEEALTRLQRSADVRLFRTDLQGDITIFVKDGKLYGTVDKNLDAKVWIPANADVNEGNAKAEMTEETEEDVLNLLNGTDFTGEAAAAAGIRGVDTSSALFWPERDYVLNKNTKKFHYPECKSVAQMSAKNRQDVTATRQELIEQGYEPCKNCNP